MVLISDIFKFQQHLHCTRVIIRQFSPHTVNSRSFNVDRRN
ncbi:MAG: hypothetical protein ACFFD4_28990 [Candidatus Odinarchaeota archaeon]